MSRLRSTPVDEITGAQARLMDWAQMLTALSAGAAGVLTIQKVIQNLNKKSPTQPLENNERRHVLLQLIKLEQIGLNQEAAIGRIEGRMDEFDHRIRAIERSYARSRPPEYPNSGSTD
jgi:hypothetical protein